MRMHMPNLSRAVLCVAALAFTANASADVWNERTILTFSEPVMIPGATLAPGAYVFQIAEASSQRNTVVIRNQDTQQQVAIAQTVPVRRTERSDETVLRFNPTETGAPVALKAWFYSGETTGHEFVYPEHQARHIAERTKTIVLSSDAPFGEPTAGRLRTYDGSGREGVWKADPETMKSWAAWVSGRSAAERTAERGEASEMSEQSREEMRQSTAPMVTHAGTEAQKVELDELDDEAERYVGQRVSVDAEVEEVYGPRLFSIDEPGWFDRHETLVFMPSTLAALVKDDDRVTVTGTLRPYTEIEVEEDFNWFGWFGDDPEVEVELRNRMVLVADRVVGGDNNVALMINVPQPGERTRMSDDGRATSGDDNGSARPQGQARQQEQMRGESTQSTSPHGAPIEDLDTVVSGRDHLVGRVVTLENVKVDGKADDGGLFVGDGEGRLFVTAGQCCRRDGWRRGVDRRHRDGHAPADRGQARHVGRVEPRHLRVHARREPVTLVPVSRRHEAAQAAPRWEPPSLCVEAAQSATR